MEMAAATTQKQEFEEGVGDNWRIALCVDLALCALGHSSFLTAAVQCSSLFEPEYWYHNTTVLRIDVRDYFDLPTFTPAIYPSTAHCSNIWPPPKLQARAVD